MTGGDALWRPDENGAELKCGPLVASARAKTASWLSLHRWHSASFPSTKVLGVIFNEPITRVDDCHIRAGDFIVDYAPTRPQRIVPQVWWRAREVRERSSVRVELVLSVRTELLDSASNWRVLSAIRDCEVFHLSNLSTEQWQDVRNHDATFGHERSREHLIVFRRKSSDLSYAEMVHPLDFYSGATTGAGGPWAGTSWDLFPEHMEKGVIRRGRICGWFMPTENDLQTAVDLAKEFVDEPLPLTA